MADRFGRDGREDIGQEMTTAIAEATLNRSVIRNQEAIEAANGDYLTPTQPVRGQTPFTNVTSSAIREMNRLARDIRNAAEQEVADVADTAAGNEAIIADMIRNSGMDRNRLPANIQDLLRGATADTTAPTFNVNLSTQLETEWTRLQSFLPDAMEEQFLREFLDAHGLQRSGTSWSANLQDQNTTGDDVSYVPIIALPPEPGRGR